MGASVGLQHFNDVNPKSWKRPKIQGGNDGRQ